MNYTVYWQTATGAAITQAEAGRCVAALRTLIRAHRQTVAVEFDQMPANSTYNVNFNGRGDGAHQTFTFYTRYLAPDEVPAAVLAAFDDPQTAIEARHGAVLHQILSQDGILSFNSCRTAQKPYDRVVKLAIMAIQRITGGKLVLADDGASRETDPPGWRALLGELKSTTHG